MRSIRLNTVPSEYFSHATWAAMIVAANAGTPHPKLLSADVSGQSDYVLTAESWGLRVATPSGRSFRVILPSSATDASITEELGGAPVTAINAMANFISSDFTVVYGDGAIVVMANVNGYFFFTVAVEDESVTDLSRSGFAIAAWNADTFYPANVKAYGPTGTPDVAVIKNAYLFSWTYQVTSLVSGTWDPQLGDYVRPLPTLRVLRSSGALVSVDKVAVWPAHLAIEDRIQVGPDVFIPRSKSSAAGVQRTVLTR